MLVAVGFIMWFLVAVGTVALCVSAHQSDRKTEVEARFRRDYGPQAVMSEAEYQELSIDAERIFVHRTWNPSLN
jgi:type III secretory pathway component EscV